MNKKKRIIVSVICLVMAALFVVGIFAVAIPAIFAVELGGEEDSLAATGEAHRTVSFNDVPSVGDEELRDGVSFICLDSKTRYLSINEKSMLNTLDAYSHTINSRVYYTSSDPSVVYVSANGLLTAKKSGNAQIFVTDKLTGITDSCMVYVGQESVPNVAPTVAPTDEPISTDPPTVPNTDPPTQPQTQPATQPKPTAPPATQPVTEPVQTDDTLSIAETSATLYVGNYYHVVATSNTVVSFSSSDTSKATVDSRGIVTALSAGTVKIRAATLTKSAECTLKIVSGKDVEITHSSISVSRFMTFRTYSYTPSVTWSSSDPTVATVDEYGFVYGVKAGTAVVKASTSNGAATCIVTVTPSNPVRFAYTSPNCAAKNQNVSLICITDTMRTAVRFQVNEGGSVRYVNASSKKKDGDTYIWTATTSFSTSGTHKVKAYSQFNGGTSWSSHTDGDTTAFVTDTTDMTTTVCAERRASDDVIDLIALFEGFLSEIYLDPWTDDPTLGYGRVIFIGETFYNNLTKNEAYAYLVQTVNNEGYASGVNDVLMNHDIKYNQQQFDALVCFVYNCGLGPLYSDDDLIDAMLDCYDGTGSKKSYYISDDYVRIRKGPGTDYDILDELLYGTELTVLDSSAEWWQVQLKNGTKGYVMSDFISYSSSGGVRDFNYINKNKFIKYLCQYHHAGGDCLWGLLYRRVDEIEIFFYNDFEPCYGDYKYPINYTCPYNASIHT